MNGMFFFSCKKVLVGVLRMTDFIWIKGSSDAVLLYHHKNIRVQSAMWEFHTGNWGSLFLTDISVIFLAPMTTGATQHYYMWLFFKPSKLNENKTLGFSIFPLYERLFARFDICLHLPLPNSVYQSVASSLISSPLSPLSLVQENP